MSDHVEQSVEVGGFRGVYRAVREEYGDARPADVAVLGATLAGVGAEWGTGNEALLGVVGGHVHEATNDPLVTSAVTGGVSFVEQLTLGAMMAATIDRFPHVVSSLRNLTANAREHAKTADNGFSKVGRFIDAFVLGAAVDVVIANTQRAQTRAENNRRVLASAAMVGTSVAAIGGGASAALKVGAEHGFETQAHVAVNVISSPWTYAGLFGAKFAYNRIRKWHARRTQNQDNEGEVISAMETPSNIDSTERRVSDFATYRELCDRESGLTKVGLTIPELYEATLASGSVEFGIVGGQAVPVVAFVDPFHIPEPGEVQEATADRNALVPVAYIPAELRHNLVTTRQFLLDSSSVQQILEPAEGAKLHLRDVPGFLIGKVEGELVHGHGEPQFTVLTRYDVSDCDRFRDNAPTDMITREGHTITTDKARILEHLPELVKMQEDIFKRQAARIGYYDGMVGDIIERFLSDDAFIGAAAFDKETGKPFMFALFGLGIDSLSQVPWLNKDLAIALMQDGGSGENPTLALPIIITAKFNGMGVFAETVSQAMHEILYRTKEDKVLHALYNANLQSVLYTPRIIHAEATRNGARPLDSLIEVSATTKLP